jgi:pyruvate dehydrogenase E2 component (dihydrolipoamide acetyltransferase)
LILDHDEGLLVSVTSGTVPVVVPPAGVGMEEALLTAWLREPQAYVEAGEPIVEIETDKSTMVIESPASGVFEPSDLQIGSIVPVGGVLAHVRLAADEASATTDPAPTVKSQASAAAAVVTEPELEPAARPLAATALPSPEAPTAREPHRQSPRARFAQPDAGAAQPHPAMRAAIARSVSESWRTIPHFTVTTEAAGTPILRRVEVARQTTPDVTVTDILLRALTLALADGQTPTERQTSILGLAVATPSGVVIPVLQDSPENTYADLAIARRDAVTRARNRRLNEDDMTVTPRATLSNLGVADVDFFTGIIPVGQQLLLTVGRLKERVTVAPGGAVVAAPTMFVTVNADHREVDGMDAAELLNRFLRHLANDDALAT